ncbi:MAG: hypothetical protein IJZ08_05660 [Clostridia bacterium]|nr:hypothetical protein [Clostridia bacterium]
MRVVPVTNKSRYVALIAMALILVSQPWGQTVLVSIGTWMIFFAAFYDMMKAFRMRFTRPSAIVLFSILILSLFSLVAAAGFTYKSFVALFCFWEIPIFLQFSTQNITRNFAKKVYYLFLGLATYYLFLALSPLAFNYKGPYGIVQLSSLTLGYQNPNQTGMYLLVCFFILLGATTFFEEMKWKIIYAAASAVVGILIILTDSRACILLAIGYTIYYIFFRKNSWPALTAILTKIAFIIPIAVFVFIIGFQQTSQNIQLLGEVFDTGRFAIYTDVFKQYNFMEFVLGSFVEYRYENLHNAYLSVFATSGIFVVVFFVLFLRGRFLEIHKNVTRCYQQLAYIGLLMLIVHMSIEAAFFTAGSVYAISVMCLVWISSQKIND